MTRKHNLKLEDKIAKLANIKVNLDLPGADLYDLQKQVNKLSKDAAKKYSNITNPSANIKSYLSDLEAVKLRIDVAVDSEKQRQLGNAHSMNSMVEDEPKSSGEPNRVSDTPIRTSQDESEEASTTFLEACYNALCKFYENLLEWIDYLTPDYFKTSEQAPENTSVLGNNSMFRGQPDDVSEEGSWVSLHEQRESLV